MKKLSLTPRSAEEMQQMYVTLIGFLMEHPDFQYAETADGVLVVIPTLKVSEPSAIIQPKKDIIK